MVLYRRYPQLWSFSNQYKSGKYVADGRWSDTAVSEQCGVAVLLRRMVETGLIDFADQPLSAEEDEPLISRYTTTKPTDPSMLARAEGLQRGLNTFPGIFVKVDGFPDERTSNAFKRLPASFFRETRGADSVDGINDADFHGAQPSNLQREEHDGLYEGKTRLLADRK